MRKFKAYRHSSWFIVEEFTDRSYNILLEDIANRTGARMILRAIKQVYEDGVSDGIDKAMEAQDG